MEFISLKKDLVCVQRCTLGAKESGGVEILISGVRGGNKKKLQILSQTRLHVDRVLWQETPNSGVLCVGGMQMLSSNRCEILNCPTTTTPSAQRVLNQGSLC